MAEACRQAAGWNRQLPGQPLSLSVNLSARQLEHPDLVEDVRAALAASGLQPELLVIEITESLLAADAEMAIRQLERLKALRVRVAVDDFGTGYSALSYLRMFPVDVLKVDKSFIDNIAGAPEQAALGRAVIELGHALDLLLVAEGIERSDQVQALRSLGCQLGQGFLLARPLSHDRVTDLLNERPGRMLAEPAPGRPAPTGAV
jgi:EAL domain-containing protein (putative c-di-GMP-specific phosphodiesterase class I)